MTKRLITLLFMTFAARTYAQQELPLYPDGQVPNSKPANVKEEHKTPPQGVLLVSGVTMPTITVYRPTGKPNGTAIVICPGGGYSYLAAGYEGADEAQRFAALGITAFVLKYRLPSDEIMPDKKIGPLQDAQQAILWIRTHAAEYQLDPHKVGIMGFSAGGHLASTAATHFNKAYISNTAGISLRPDFQLLIYPVVTFGTYAHSGSRDQLLGKNAPDSLVRYFSNELQVTKETPPAFLVCAEDDNVVPAENSINYVLALKANGVGATLHLYEKGGHGFGMNNKTTQDQWWDRCVNWLKDHDLL